MIFTEKLKCANALLDNDYSTVYCKSLFEEKLTVKKVFFGIDWTLHIFCQFVINDLIKTVSNTHASWIIEYLVFCGVLLTLIIYKGHP